MIEGTLTNSDGEAVRVDTTPRGAKTVLARILKDGANYVTLFFAQTLVSSLRDQGYRNDTTSALCEHVDNAIEAGATEVRVFFRQSGGKGAYTQCMDFNENSKVILNPFTSMINENAR